MKLYSILYLHYPLLRLYFATNAFLIVEFSLKTVYENYIIKKSYIFVRLKESVHATNQKKCEIQLHFKSHISLS